MSDLAATLTAADPDYAALSATLDVDSRVYVRKVMFALFREVLGVSDPAAGLASAGRLVVMQFAVQSFNQLDALAQRCTEDLRRFVFEMPEVLQTL